MGDGWCTAFRRPREDRLKPVHQHREPLKQAVNKRNSDKGVDDGYD
jgi:hypothetical protein